MKLNKDPIERTWFDEQPVDHPVLRILLAALAVGIVIIVVGYCMDGTF